MSPRTVALMSEEERQALGEMSNDELAEKPADAAENAASEVVVEDG